MTPSGRGAGLAVAVLLLGGCGGAPSLAELASGCGQGFQPVVRRPVRDQAAVAQAEAVARAFVVARGGLTQENAAATYRALQPLVGGAVARTLSVEDLQDRAGRQEGGVVRVRRAEPISEQGDDRLSLLLLTDEERRHRPGPGGTSHDAGQWGVDLQRTGGQWRVHGFSLESAGPC